MVRSRIWCFTAIYASPNIHARNALWDKLCDIGGNNAEAMVLIGDFNAVFFAHERSSGILGLGNKDMKFVRMVYEIGLVDLGFSGARSTWCA